MIYKVETFVDEEDRNVIVKTPLNDDGFVECISSGKEYWASAYIQIPGGDTEHLSFKMDGIGSLKESFELFDSKVENEMKKIIKNHLGEDNGL